MRVADFFCGSGGFSEGFRQAGFQIVFAVDKWEPAVTTYKGNKAGVNVILDDVIRISNLGDEEFEKLVPDSEVIIGSPPCQAFSQSNKSGNADKTLGIKLIEAYLRIIARKKYKSNSILKYWVLENVPNVQQYIKDKYTAEDLDLEGDFILKTRGIGSGVYNAKNFGAPTNRKRFLCGDFPLLKMTHSDEDAVKLQSVISALRNSIDNSNATITDINYPELVLPRNCVSDSQYIYELAPFEWKVAKRLKKDRGYMGKMSFPENLEKPARTVMATMSSSSRESMILGFDSNRFRLPTVREVASMMSFPIDYRFYGKSKGIKHTLVGNAVPPKLSYAIAKAIALDLNKQVPDRYIPINYDESISFFDLNGKIFPMNQEKPKREVAKFKYHIPYLIISAFRVELTNYHSNYNTKDFRWDVEIHYSQGKDKANIYTFESELNQIKKSYRREIKQYLNNLSNKLVSFNEFQRIYCLTSEQRKSQELMGPYELLEDLKKFIGKVIPENNRKEMISVNEKPNELPEAILVGYYMLQEIVKKMGGID